MMNKILPILLFFTSVAFAETNNPYIASVSGLKKINLNQDNSLIKLNAKIPELGNVRIKLNKSKFKNLLATFTNEDGVFRDTSNLEILAGTFKNRKVRGKIAATINRDQKTLSLGFLIKKNRRNKTRYYKTKVRINKNKGFSLVRKTRNINHISEFCGLKLTKLDNQLVESLSSERTLLPATIREIEFNLDGDSQWFDIFRGNSNSRILSIVNEADEIYQDQLSIKFKVNRINTYASQSFGTSNSNTKLDSYINFTASTGFFPNADAYHLFTGENLDSGVIGLAVLGQVCRANGAPFGLTQFTSTAGTVITFAHEIGHNLNAVHDNGGFCPVSNDIMAPSLGFPFPEKFSDCSVNTINNFIDRFGSCLSEEDDGVDPETPTPNPTPDDGSDDDSGDDEDDGDGGDGGGSPPPDDNNSGVDRPDINLENIELIVNLERSGQVSFTVLLDSINPACNIDVFGYFKKGKANTRKKILSFNPSTKNLTHSFTIKRKSIDKQTKKRVNLGLSAKITCEGSIGETQIYKIKSGKIKTKKKAPAARWFRLFAKEVKRNIS